MIKRIIAFIIFPCMIIALLLSFAGVEQIEFGTQYYDFIKSVNIRLSAWELTIPNIPNIPSIPESTSTKPFELITALIWIGNLLVKFFNGLISVINIVIIIANVVVHLLQFIFTLIYSVKDFVTGVAGVRFLSV